MATPKRQFLDGRFGQIHFRTVGSKDSPNRPLLCLHMFPQSGRNFERLLSVASDEYYVIAPDFPGYGESSPPPAPISAPQYAESIWELIDALNLLERDGTIDVFGIHAGAKLAVELSNQRPADVNKIILSSAAVLYPEELAELRSVFSPIELDEDGTRLKHLWSLLVKNRGPDMTYEMMATSFAEMLRGGEGYEWGHHAVFEYNSIFPEIIGALPHPIKLLNPMDDLYKMTPRTEAHLQNGDMMDRPDWGHGFLETKAEDVWSEIEKFLKPAALEPATKRFADAK